MAQMSTPSILILAAAILYPVATVAMVDDKAMVLLNAKKSIRQGGQPNPKQVVQKRSGERKSGEEQIILPGQFREIDQNANRWDTLFGPRMTQLMQKKALATRRIQELKKKIANAPDVPPEERKFQLRTFEIFTKEMNDTEEMIVQAMQWLESVLKGDYKVSQIQIQICIPGRPNL